MEIILVNDGSTDGSNNDCDEYIKKDDRVKVIHKRNGGVSSARNADLDIVSGEYIIFIDSDDWIEPILIEVLYNSLNNKGVDIAIAGVNIINLNKTTNASVSQTMKCSQEETLKLLFNNKIPFI